MRIEQVTNDQQLEDAYSVRKIVFVEEQNVSIEEEMDEFDQVATHFVGYEEDQPISASRLRFVGEYAKLERICMIKSSRGQGLGKQMILHMEGHAKDKGYLKSKLNAQTQALGFYESLGYRVVSEEFMDAGIPHVTMIKDL
ncbi:acetyltransferase [Pontibacillus chungwhensis BH030062]|uniref:Acetyltransferase n=1 Tax=Pontibacillus chungwhensis BH030062 TaxID=1385513 RepID=A0A0A2VAG5_9BACI|nr:GNAT family N-acetyltransferase [Pontibacillus chungwhensis]KGP90690.1 acetyltransferase [Pontibacillus chungwhensis BH030062]